MPIIGVTVPDAATAVRIATAVCGYSGYQATVPAPNPADPPVPNPQTPAQFVVAQVRQFLLNQVRQWEANQAANTARAAADAKVVAEVLIT